MQFLPTCISTLTHTCCAHFSIFTLQDLPSRPRRNRRSPTIRHAFSETHLSPSNLILPVFVHDGEKNSPISSMPGVNRLGWRHGLIDSVREARSFGVNQVVIFPKVEQVAKLVSSAVATAIAKSSRASKYYGKLLNTSCWCTKESGIKVAYTYRQSCQFTHACPSCRHLST